jgi:putative flippase GtrA
MLKLLQNKFSLRLFLFVCVGTISFILDATVLYILIFDLGWGYYISRVVSFLTAVPFSWLMNRMLTFRDTATDNRRREYTLYLLIQGAGALLNFVLYSVCILLSSTMKDYPVIALGIGSLVAMLFNYKALERFAFTGKTEARTE